MNSRIKQKKNGIERQHRYFLVTLFILLFISCIPAMSQGASKINIPVNYLNLNTGLAGWWTMDGKDTPWTSATAATAIDKSGNGNTGTLTNMNQTVAPTMGKIGQALTFDGATNYINVPDSGSVDSPSSAITISAWIRTNSTARQRIVIKPFSTSFEKSYNFEIGNDSLAGSVTLSLLHDSTQDVQWETGAGAVSTGVWTHLAVTWASTNGDANDAKIYVNAVSQGGLTFSTNNYAAGMTIGYNTGLPLRIGNGNDRIPDAHYFSGQIDDVRIYSRALSQAEIQQIYNFGVAIHQNMSLPGVNNLGSGLMGWWTFDGKNLIQNATDSSGQGNTGYLQNFTSTTTVLGKIGQALSLNGSTQYVTAGDSSTLSPGTGNWTVAMWFKTANQAYQELIRKYDAAGNSTYGIEIAADGKLDLLYRDASNNETSLGNSTNGVGSVVTDGKWHQVVWVRSGTTASYYLDSSFVNSNTNASMTDINTNGGDSLNIARWPDPFGSSPNAYLNGSVDDVRLYNYALSAAQVLQLYNQGKK